jgi:hypothetical protein
MRSASIPKVNIDTDGRGCRGRRRAMTDYWLNKLFFDLQQPELAVQYKKDREAVLSRYPLSAELRCAVLADDLAALAPHGNAYLLRFYFAICGMKDAEFIGRLNELPAKSELPAKGVPRHG